MRRLATILILSVSVVGNGLAQLITVNSGTSLATTSDDAEYYTSTSTTFLQEFSASTSGDLGTSQALTDPAWTATYAHGVATSLGESASCSGSFANETVSTASFTALLGASTDISTTFSNAGNYYGVAGDSSAESRQSFHFTPTASAKMQLSGAFSALGSPEYLLLLLEDSTTATDYYVLQTSLAGLYSINTTFNLTAGDNYYLLDDIQVFSDFQFDPGHSFPASGSSGATGYITANFVAAPEPLSCLLPAIGAVALWRRRRTLAAAAIQRVP